MDGDDHRQLTGIVTEGRLLCDEGRLSVDESDRLEDAYAWFNEHVPVPPFATNGWSRDVVSWFKGDAGDAISRMWDLVSTLRDHGVPTRMLRTAQPGKVLYEDQFQVVIEEWRNL